MRSFVRYITLVAVIFLSSCANYKVHVKEDHSTPPPRSESALLHRVFLVGDAGEETDIQERTLGLLRQLADTSQVPFTCLFLGDNIYPSGMPSKKKADKRVIAENALLKQMEVLAESGQDVIFLGGNHDWNEGHPGALKAIKRQAEFIEDFNHKNVKYIPEAGCPGPEEIELTDDVVLIIIDSQWWLQDWSTEKDINDDCEHRTRFEFMFDLSDMIRDNREKQIIIASHHPPVSSGSHGGYFTWKDHLFPFTAVNEKLWIPLPVLGSIHPVYRSTYGHVQDQPHPKYDELIQGMLFALDKYEDVIVVSGHQHSLEYHEVRGHHLLVSGSGSRLDPIAKTPSTVYGHTAPGVMQLDLYERGRVNLEVWEADEEGKSESPAFSTRLVDARKPVEELVADVPDRPETDSTVAEVSKNYAKGKTYRFLFGERYRALYELPVKAKNIALLDEHGGLKPVKKGGGLQTNSLRLEAPDGHQYVLRSLNKDATRLLPQIYQSTFANDVLEDQFTASHPYAAFVIPDMAEAAGIYHTNPELVYLKYQKSLGRYITELNENLYLYEERPSDSWVNQSSFGNSGKVVSFTEVVKETKKSYRNRVDQPFVVQTRMFDMFLGDWDRHDDQWRWASFPNRGGRGHYFRQFRVTETRLSRTTTAC